MSLKGNVVTIAKSFILVKNPPNLSLWSVSIDSKAEESLYMLKAFGCSKPYHCIAHMFLSYFIYLAISGGAGTLIQILCSVKQKVRLNIVIIPKSMKKGKIRSRDQSKKVKYAIKYFPPCLVLVCSLICVYYVV